MPEYTAKLNLPKPLGTENVTRAAHNELVEAIDAGAQKEITKSTTAPSNPTADDLWLDTSIIPNILKRYDEATTSWVKASPTAASEIIQDANNRFVTDTEKTDWNGKETPAGAQAKVDTGISNHEAAADPHPQYKKDTDPPNAHASSHASGGSDPITPASIGAETPAGAQAKVDTHEENLTAHTKEVTVSVAGAGWYRIAEIASSAGRGDAILSIFTDGGSYTPYSAIIKYHKQWSTEGSLIVDAMTSTSYWNSVRITEDGGLYFVEVYFTQAISVLHIQTIATAGYNASANLFNGALPVGGGTVLESLGLRIGINSSKEINANGDIYAAGGNKVYHAGNDGAGSGLDADRLQGSLPAEGNTASTIVKRNASGYVFATLFNMSYTSNNTDIDHFITKRSEDGYMRPSTKADVLTALEALGIDADTVDGKHASEFATIETGTWADTTTQISPQSTITKTIPLGFSANRAVLHIKGHNNYKAIIFVDKTSGGGKAAVIGYERKLLGVPATSEDSNYYQVCGYLIDVTDAYISGTDLKITFKNFHSSQTYTMEVYELYWEAHI